MTNKILEIDAIGVDEWEHEQHTPRAMDENLAALVKQSSAQSGPVRAPSLEEALEAETVVAAATAEPAKQRTTTNTVSRPAPPKTKTMALPTLASVKPAAPTSAVPQPVARAEAKPIASPATTKVTAKPPASEPPALAARAFTKPPTAARVEKVPPAEPKPVAKPAAKPTPPPMAAVAPKPTPPPMAVVAPKPVTPPQPIAVATTEPTPPRAPTPLPFSPTLPASTPAHDFEDWDNPRSAATSIENRVSRSRPVAPDFKDEDSVVVNLDAKPTPDKPRRPQSYPVIHTSEQKPSTSGVFVMPTAAQPNATPAPEPVRVPESSAPPIAAARPDVDRALSPGFTPVPQPLPGEPVAAPAAAGWPSASSLVYDSNAPLADEPAASLVAKRGGIAALVRNRGVLIGVAGAAVLAIVLAIASQGSHDAKQAPVVATSTPKTEPTAKADSTATHDTPTGAAAVTAPTTTTAAAVEPVAPTPKVPAKTPIVTRRIVRSRKPVVVDYDKHPTSSPLDVDHALAQAREAYSIGNQHLFAGQDRDAITAYRKALEIYPSYAAGYRGLGLAYTELDDKPSALAAFKTYVKLAPTAKDVALIKKRIRSLSVR